MQTLWDNSTRLIGKLFGCEQQRSIKDLSMVEENVPGDRTIVCDSYSGLAWLNLKATAGKSYEQVSALCKPYGELEFWRYASIAEAQKLYSLFGFGLGNLSANAAPECIARNIATMNGFLGEIIHWSGAFPAIRYSGSISLTGPQAANEKPMLLKAFCQDDGENYVLDIKGGQRMSGSKSAPYISSLLVRSINMQ